MYIWLQAARLKTIPASIVPVFLGSALAFHEGYFLLMPAFICLMFAILVQIGTNFANDYFDFLKGADTPQRIGPVRAVAGGLISSRSMLRAAVLILTIAFLVGLLLVFWGGWWLLVVGILSIVCAIVYTGGPYPLAYHGLGDVFVYVFFGLIAVMFTYYVQALSFSWASFWVGCGCGSIATNILIVNNCRDMDCDAVAGKTTTAVRFGRAFSSKQYTLNYGFAFIIPLFLLSSDYSLFVLLPLILLPLALKLSIQLKEAVVLQYNVLLSKTALFMILYGLLLSVGIILA